MQKLSCRGELWIHCQFGLGLLEQSVTHRIVFALKTSQHDFVKRISIIANFLECIWLVFKAFPSGSQTDVIYKQFNKPFDRFNHKLLICKLQPSVFLS